MKNYIIALLALVSLTAQYSCKKEKSSVAPFCRALTWNLGTQIYNYTYDASGFPTRMEVTGSGYYQYTQTGSTLVRQSYNSSGTPTGSPETSVLNGSGYYSVIPNGSDTIYISYNSDGQMTQYLRRNDTILSRLEVKYQDGDALQSITYNSDSTVNSTSVYEYYTDRENHSNLNVLLDILDPRYGKPCKHFLKRSTISSNGNLSDLTFYFTFDDSGNASSLQVINQPSNHISNLSFTYECK